MAKKLIFSIYDIKTENYNPPFVGSHRGEAFRSMMELANDSQTLIGKYPQDYELYMIGEFDDSTGQILPTDKQSLGNGVSFLKENNK